MWHSHIQFLPLQRQRQQRQRQHNMGNANIVDEWTFCQLQDRATALSALQNRWNTLITESDFTAIAATGCVLVTTFLS